MLASFAAFRAVHTADTSLRRQCHHMKTALLCLCYSFCSSSWLLIQTRCDLNSSVFLSTREKEREREQDETKMSCLFIFIHFNSHCAALYCDVLVTSWWDVLITVWVLVCWYRWKWMSHYLCVAVLIWLNFLQTISKQVSIIFNSVGNFSHVLSLLHTYILNQENTANNIH